MLLVSFASVQYTLAQMKKAILPVTGPEKWACSKGYLCFLIKIGLQETKLSIQTKISYCF